MRVAARSAPGWLWLLIVAAACNRAPPPGGKPPPDAGVPAVRSSGLRLPLPPGWSVVTGGDGALRVVSGPGRTVVRAELRRGMGMPTAESMRSGFTEGLKRLRVHHSTVVETPGYVSLRLFVGEPAADAGSDQEVYLSATSLGEDTLLCASMRGATTAELDLAEHACRGAGEPPDGG